MFKKPRDLFQYLGLNAFGVAVLLVLVHFLGELHGAIIMVILLINQVALLFAYGQNLERKMTAMKQERNPIARTLIDGQTVANSPRQTN